jgi:nicotinamidase-related amidase
MATLDGLLQNLTRAMPVAPQPYKLGSGRRGLVVVDEVNGFCTVGAGPLAPQAPNAQVSRMVAETDRLARQFADAGLPILVFCDTHEPDKPEPPYPPHCIRGTGHENLVPELAWLETAPTATIIRKDCINGFVGGMDPKGEGHAVIDWVKENAIETMIVVGICTDICVMDFVLTALSARNRELMPPLRDIVVYEPGCATYDLPPEVAEAQGLPATAAHPQALTHHAGLYFMASRGAVLASELI